MADKPSHNPDRKNLDLARRLESIRKDPDHPAGDDPLLPVLEEYKSKTDFKIRSETGKDVWQAIDRQMDSKSATVFKLSPVLWRVAAVILAAAFIGILYLQYQPDPPVLIASSDSERIEATLTDGTLVTLRPHSELYAVSEGETEQYYRVRGEAWFDVIPNTERRFSVESGDAVVTVLGTTFSISDWGDRTRVYLESGSVAFSTADGSHRVLLEPGQFSEYREDSVSQPQFIEEETFTGWLRDQLVLDRRTLADLADEISHHFGIRVVVPENYRDEQLGGTLSLDDPEQVLEDIATSLGGRFDEISPGTWQFVPDGG